MNPSRRPPHSSSSSHKPAFIARGVKLVYEDESIVVVDKPTGLVTADPARAGGEAARKAKPSAREGETLFDYVKKHVRSSMAVRKGRRRSFDDGRRGDAPGRVWVIHRLDKEASGLLVFAKTLEAFEKLKEQFRSKAAHRIYYALAEGIVGPPGSTGTQQSMIDEDRGPTSRAGRDRAHDESKKLAVTHYRVVATGEDRSLLQVRLETGRKNQIRIHMQELEHPLVGDRRFGAKTDPIGRLGLHAAELGFTHPRTGESVQFKSPPPSGFFRAVGARPGEQGPGSPVPATQDPPRAHASAKPASDTSWNEVAGWYDTLLEDKGSDHYEQVILPGAINLLAVKPGQSVLDIACGQGILSRRLATIGAKVTGVDAAPKLIESARARSPEITYHVADARDLSALNLSNFDAACCIMALSNIDPLEPAIEGIARALKPGGVFVAVITHPCFRIPGESHWGWDDKAKRQFRRIDAYLTPFKRDIKMHPGKAAHNKRGGEIETPTFHRPLGAYVQALARHGLFATDLREWPSQRAASSGPRAPEENRARLEIPLFLGIRAIKSGS